MSNVQALKRQLSLQQWSAIIEDRIVSGLKVDEYCEKNGISRNSYFYWLRKIREEMAVSSAAKGTELLPATPKQGALVELVPGKCSTPVPRIEIHPETPESIALTINGIDICVNSGISEEMLTKVMRAARDA